MALISQLDYNKSRLRCQQIKARIGAMRVATRTRNKGESFCFIGLELG